MKGSRIPQKRVDPADVGTMQTQGTAPPMRALSLFSGVGGFDLALERAGVEIAAQCEIDPRCRDVLAKRFPGVPCHDDVTTLKNWRLTEEQKQSAVEMYDAGMSCADVGNYFGVSRQSMWDVLRRRTTMRPQERSGADNHFWRGGTTADDYAQNCVEYALRSGRLVRPDACEQCGGAQEFTDGRAGIQAHHCDYNRPLDVMWLCQRCHHEWHRTKTAVSIEGGGANGSQTVDLIVGGFP